MTEGGCLGHLCALGQTWHFLMLLPRDGLQATGKLRRASLVSNPFNYLRSALLCQQSEDALSQPKSLAHVGMYVYVHVCVHV